MSVMVTDVRHGGGPHSGGPHSGGPHSGGPDDRPAPGWRPPPTVPPAPPPPPVARRGAERRRGDDVRDVAARLAPAVLTADDHPGLAWYVLHTRSRQEKILADEFGRRGVLRYLPTVRSVREYGRRRAEVVVDAPLFAGYLFLLGTVEQAYAGDRAGRVANIIRVADQGRLDWELVNLQRATDLRVPLAPCPRPARGRRVVVRSGPFQGLRGVVETNAGGDRLVLEVAALGQAVSLDVRGSAVELLPD